MHFRLINEIPTMTLPSDPFMLLSLVNMKLRDGAFESLSDFCKSEGIDEKELVSRLASAGFEWMPSAGQFR